MRSLPQRGLSTAVSSAASSTHLRSLGSPATLLSVSLAPSLPIYFQKGALLSIHGGSTNNISSKVTWLSPVKRILYGFHSFRYQQLETTSQATALISAGKSQNATVSTLSLDGSVDWAILPNDSVLAYTGSSLRVTTEPLPRFVKKDGWLKLLSQKTGLYSPWKIGYSLISGRGDVALKGEGSVYTIELSEGEDVVVKRANVVGISVNGDELARCVNEHKGFITSTIKPEKEVNEAAEVVIQEIEEEQNKQLEQVKQYWNQVKTWASYITRLVIDSLPKPDNSYIQIKGPRTILVQSHIKQLGLNFPQTTKIETIESEIKSSTENTSPEDFLSYVTVKDGKVTFNNTPDFQKTVQSYETKKE